MKEIKWQDAYKLPLHNQELYDDYVLSYVFAANGTMSLQFERRVTQEDRKKIVNIINNDDDGVMENILVKNGDFFYKGEKIFTVRGWGYLTGIGGLNLPQAQAAKIQDDFISFIYNNLTTS